MKFVFALLFCLFVIARVSASPSHSFDHHQNFARERKVNYVNGERQANVNYIAESVKASSGTFRRDGVPGTGVGGYAYGGNYAHPGSKGAIHGGNYVYDGKYYFGG